METRSMRRLGKKPLPGERQGTSGAGAGRDSMQTTGGRSLNRRAPTGSPENTTADTQGSAEDPQAPPTDSVLRESQPSTTKAGKERQRLKWTIDINTFIMRTYYKITKLETDLTMYRHELYQQFKMQYPELNVTEQRIADQRRTIVTNNLLPQTLLEEIKSEVAKSLSCRVKQTNLIVEDSPQNTDSQTAAENIEQTIETSLRVGDSSRNTTQTPPRDAELMVQTSNEDVLITKVRDEFYAAIIEFEGSDPTQRHSIPKQNTSRKLARIVEILNKSVIPNYLIHHSNFTDVHTAVYCGAVAAARCNGSHTKERTQQSRKVQKKPKWEQRIDNKITNIRKDLGRLTQYKQGNRSKNIVKHTASIFTKIKTHTKHESHNQHVDEYIDTLQQKLSAYCQRLRRYKECAARKKHNTLFHSNEKMFYKSLREREQPASHNGIPTKDEIETYWSSLWSTDRHHDDGAPWITEEEMRCQQMKQMEFTGFTAENITCTIQKTHNWKAAGVDNIHNYWYKKFTCTHTLLAKHLTNFVQQPETMPPYLTQGITYMKSKDSDTTNPSKYRPITCLPTIYKILTSCLADKIYAHCDMNEVIAEQQKGCRQHSQGCKEQLLIDAVALEQARKDHRNIYTAYIDYSKAFDSVPHSWLLKVLKIYKIHPAVVTFLEYTMGNWKTAVTLVSQDKCVTTDPISIRRGIYQGDSLSPLWFCLALNPLSTRLNNSNYGFNIKSNKVTQFKLSHLMYMDDIKLYATTETQLTHLLKITENFSRDIAMKFGIDKCKIQKITQGKCKYNGFQLQTGETIEAMSGEDTYKYLGFAQSRRIEHRVIRETLVKTYMNRLTKILKSQLNGKNKFKAINTFAVPVLTYSFGIIHWTKTDLENIERKTRTALTKHRVHHPNSSIERLKLPRKEGGRGIIDITNLHNKIIHVLQEYFVTQKNDSLLHKAIVLADSKLTPLNLHHYNQGSLSFATEPPDKYQFWKQKILHGRHRHDLEQPHVDLEASNAWLSRGDLFAETEGLMIAIQDQVINTRNYRKYILKDSTLENDLCRRCHLSSETIQHITSGCKAIAQTDYKHRHDQVAKILHQRIAINSKLLENKQPYYKYTPTTVMENPACKLYWDRTIITDKTIAHNRPDITLIDKINKITYLIDIAIPNTHNLQSSHTEKVSKYTDLAMEIKEQWKMEKVYTIPIIVSTTGVIPRTLHNSLQQLNLAKTLYMELQKAVILKTCAIVRKFLNNSITHA